MLYFAQIYPWDNSKYLKRLRRLVFMYFIELLTNKNLDYNAKTRYLKYVRDKIFGMIYNKTIVIENINKFLAKCDLSRPDQFPFCIMLQHLKELLGKPYDIVKFEEYIKTIFDNIGGV